VVRTVVLYDIVVIILVKVTGGPNAVVVVTTMVVTVTGNEVVMREITRLVDTIVVGT
jgi:hypothetical protein